MTTEPSGNSGELERLKNAACSDGNCVFKITPEMRKGMTNGGCCCLKDMTYGIGHRKTHGVMELSRIASEAEAALAAKDARIKELEILVFKMKCCENCKHGYDSEIKCGIQKAHDCPLNSRWEAR